jgi:hypothetical protein
MSPISTKQQKVKTVMVNICHQYQQNNRKFDIGDICWPSLFKLSVVLLILVTYVDHHCFNFLLFCWYWWHMLTITVLSFCCFVDICHQYQQNKRKLKQWWSTYVTNINKTTESLNNDGQHMSPISTKPSLF